MKSQDRFQHLRERAGRLMQSMNSEEFEDSKQGIQELLQELQTYQIELELQHEEFIAAQGELEKSRSEYRHLFEFAPIGYFIFNEQGIVVDANFTGLDLLQVSRSRAIGKPFLVYLRSKDKTRFVQHLHHVLETGDRQTCNLCVQRKNGTHFYAQIQSVPINGVNEDEVCIRTAILDITERHQLEEELIAEREKAVEAAQFMNEFLANMSHEIRTPLAGVIGFAEVLKEELKDEHQEVAQIICGGGNRLLNTLNSVLDFARLQAKNPNILLMPTNLYVSVAEQCRLLSYLAEQKNLTISFEAENKDMHALVDASFFDRIVSNLVSNAIKYTPNGGIKIKLYVRQDMVELSVEDTGIGIKEEFLPMIFEPFRQEHMGADRPYEGVGLGLSITKRLIDLMEGEIEVDSEPGKGSKFLVRFLKLDSDLRYYTNDIKQYSADPVIDDFDDCSVLVVEDNWETMLLVKRILKPICNVKTARTYDEAIEAFSKETFNIALIDVNLGDSKTGTDLLRHIRALPHAEPFYGVAFTAYALPSDHAQFLTQGFDDYLPKPFTKANLLTVLERARLAQV